MFSLCSNDGRDARRGIERGLAGSGPVCLGQTGCHENGSGVRLPGRARPGDARMDTRPGLSFGKARKSDEMPTVRLSARGYSL